MTEAVNDALLADLADVILRISREIDPHGAKAIDIATLNGTEALVMRWVWMHPGTTPGSTAKAVGVRSSNVSVALRALEDKGLLERRADASDSRVVRLFQTSYGLEMINRVHAHWADRLREALGGDERHVQLTVDLLVRLDWQLRTGTGK